MVLKFCLAVFEINWKVWQLPPNDSLDSKSLDVVNKRSQAYEMWRNNSKKKPPWNNDQFHWRHEVVTVSILVPSLRDNF